MKNNTQAIQIIRRALNFYWYAAGMYFPNKDEIRQVSEEIEEILQIDPKAEFESALKILNDHAKKEREEAKANGNNDPTAILGYYENQIQGGGIEQ